MSLLTVLLPQRCVVCRRPDTPLCPACRSALLRIGLPVCDRCGAPGPWPLRRCAECTGRRLAFTTARAAIVYDDRARAFVGAWKEHGRRDLAREAAALVVAVVPRPAAEALCFVPGDPDRTLKRGYVTARALAAELAESWELPLTPILRRPATGPQQRRLPCAERRSNVAQAFACSGAAPRRICLVDDVYTTGSTVSACATQLRRAGARRVDVVCFARAVR
jgi:predicted amidophosphoribosyltransferase